MSSTGEVPDTMVDGILQKVIPSGEGGFHIHRNRTSCVLDYPSRLQREGVPAHKRQRRPGATPQIRDEHAVGWEETVLPERGYIDRPALSRTNHRYPDAVLQGI
jgi:hypothetical protein